jgi:hypothetical protein
MQPLRQNEQNSNNRFGRFKGDMGHLQDRISLQQGWLTPLSLATTEQSKPSQRTFHVITRRSKRFPVFARWRTALQ